eukprot:903331-Ditylum_brightwellii.AAC.1
MMLTIVLTVLYLSRGVDCHLTQRSKQNEHGVGNKDNDVDHCVDDDVDNSVEDGVDDSVEDGDDGGVDDSVDGADKHLTHLSQWVNCQLTQRSEGNKHVGCDKDDDVVHDVDNSDDSVDKHLTHLSQGVECHLTQRSEQDKHVVGDKCNDVTNNDGVVPHKSVMIRVLQITFGPIF